MSSRGSTASARKSNATGATRAKASTRDRAAAPEAPHAEPGQRVQHIPVSSIHTGLNPRESFDPERIKELADSIREHGLLQPISVRPHNGTYQLIAGERRYRAMQSLGMKTVPAIVHHVDEAKARELALIENINRVDMKPSETAKAYQALADRGLSTKQIAERTGKSEAHISQHLSLLTLPWDVQKAVDDEHVPSSVVRDLAKLSTAGQREAAARIVTDDLGVRSAKQLIRAIAARESQTEMFPTESRQATRQELSARDRYEQTISRITDALHGLDDETISHYARILDTPTRETQRLDVMMRQLRHLQDSITFEAHRRGMSVDVGTTRKRKSA